MQVSLAEGFVLEGEVPVEFPDLMDQKVEESAHKDGSKGTPR